MIVMVGLPSDRLFSWRRIEFSARRRAGNRAHQDTASAIGRALREELARSQPEAMRLPILTMPERAASQQFGSDGLALYPAELSGGGYLCPQCAGDLGNSGNCEQDDGADEGDQEAWRLALSAGCRRCAGHGCYECLGVA